MKQIFVDSGLFKAFVDPNDTFHLQAKTFWKESIFSNAPLITTNYILDETFTLIRIKCNLERALELRNVLFYHEANLQIERITVDDDAAAWEWFEKDWSKLSYTDCVSFAIMKRLELTDVATFDDHFTRAGFSVYPKK